MKLKEYLTKEEAENIKILRTKLKNEKNIKEYNLIKNHIALTLKNAVLRRKKELKHV